MAKRLAVRPKTVRWCAFISALVFGAGVLAYVGIWILIPREDEDDSIIERSSSDRRDRELLVVSMIVAIASLVVILLLDLHSLGVLTWILVLSALGVVQVFRGASTRERSHLQRLVESVLLLGSERSTTWRTIAIRVTLGLVALAIGISRLSQVGREPGAAAGVLVGTVALVVGIFVVFAPWWVKTVRELTDERRERIRAQSRADMATHIHDSVLQTLSLIQRAADRPAEVTRLARSQERELRHWLIHPDSFGVSETPASTLREAVLEIEREVEDNYGVAVDVVVVGSCMLNDTVSTLLSAGREATINAAKWSEADEVSIYIEVEPTQISMFVRDVGVGFDLDQIPSDRHGIARSIVDRMRRIHGESHILSTPGGGTEVKLLLPFHPAHQ